MLTGEPEYLDPLGEETPEGWIVTGYPWYAIDTPEHNAFLKAYQDKYNEHPRLGTIIGYSTIVSIAAGIEKAGSTDTEAMIKAFRGLDVVTPFGPITYRTQDQQSTQGAYVGVLAKQDGKGIMTHIRYVDGKEVQPTDEQVSQWRPAAANQ